MIFPNYKDGSIVNLASSLIKAMGGKPLYKPLKGLDVSAISKKKNIILLVIDGLGYEYLKGRGDNSFTRNLNRKMTSLFPSTTAVCIPAFSTGVPAQQHGITGWFMYFREFGSVGVPLPFIPRHGGVPYSLTGVDPYEIYSEVPISELINRKSYSVLGDKIIDSDASLSLAGISERMGYTTMNGFFRQISIALKKKGDKFIHAYWPDLDSLGHEFGIDSVDYEEHFEELEKKFSSFVERLPKNTVLIATADHGMIDIPEENFINVDDHPKLKDCMALPLCGESRAAYFYIKPGLEKQFESYVKEKFSDKCELHKSQDLIDKNYFGLFKPNPKLKERVGDYVMIMKDNYAIRDFLASEELHFNKGVHGGTSEKEMWVPLIVIEK